MKRFIIAFTCLLALMHYCVEVKAADFSIAPNGSNNVVNITGNSTYESGTNDSMAFTPKVTSIHSLNAKFANDGESVYFIPQLEDFPVDLANAVNGVYVDGQRIHGFAAVYDGDFNQEVLTDAASVDLLNSQLRTSKKVYSETETSRALELIGYDTLLADETANITFADSTVHADYMPTLVSRNDLPANVIVMDLYKALQQYEWDIKAVYTSDDSINLSTHPIQQQISVDVSNRLSKGIDTSEGATWVFATRTNPALYWEKADKDNIFDGGAHLLTNSSYVGTEVSASFSKSEQDTVTWAELCSIARAIMNLYGEPYDSSVSSQANIASITKFLPEGFTDESVAAICYCHQKGLIDPTTVDFTSNVQFADFLDFIWKIRDNQMRKVTIVESSILNAEGFAQIDIDVPAIMPDFCDEVANPLDVDYYDYFILSNAITDFKVRNKGSDTWKLKCDDLQVFVDGSFQKTSTQGKYKYLGVVEMFGNKYYHMQIGIDVSPIYVTVGYDPETEEISSAGKRSINGYLYYELEPGGGFYDGAGAHTTLEDADADYIYIDADRRFNDYLHMYQAVTPLANTHWYVIKWSKEQALKAFTVGQGCYWTDNTKSKEYDNSETSTDVGLWQLVDTDVGWIESATWKDWIPNYVVAYADHGFVGSDDIRVIFQTSYNKKDFFSHFKFGSSGTKKDDVKDQGTAMYRYSDNTIMMQASKIPVIGSTNNITVLSDKSGYKLTTKSNTAAGTTIIIRNKGNQKYLVYGNTFTTLDKDTVLWDINPKSYTKGSDPYINVNLCYKFAPKITVHKTDTGYVPILSEQTLKKNVSYSTATINTLWPTDTSTKLVKASFDGHSGVALFGSNPLSSYMVVEGPNNIDYLFSWHRNGLQLKKDTISDIEDQRSEFESLTGVSLSYIGPDYVLSRMSLDRSSPPSDFHLVTLEAKNVSEYKNTVGWIYTPKEYTDLVAAQRDYESEKLPIPIVKMGGSYYNVNNNTSYNVANDSPITIGQLPYEMSGKMKAKDAKDLKETEVEDDADIEYTDVPLGKLVGTQYEEIPDSTIANVVIYRAPIGMFYGVYGLGSSRFGSETKGTFYYGGSLVKNSKKQWIIGNSKLNISEKAEIVRVFGGDNASTYVILNDESGLADDLGDGNVDASMEVSDPEKLVDWEAFEFSRLVENLDTFSSIAILFCLAIFPRIAMILFFSLAILGLIRNVPPWRMFCQRVFDVYKFLTFGKQNVDTINTNKLIITSCFALAIFSLLLDGTIFYIIIWFSRLFVIFTQR